MKSHLILILSIRALFPLQWKRDSKIHLCICGDFTTFISPFRAQCHRFTVDNATNRWSGFCLLTFPAAQWCLSPSRQPANQRC